MVTTVLCVTRIDCCVAILRGCAHMDPGMNFGNYTHKTSSMWLDGMLNLTALDDVRTHVRVRLTIHPIWPWAYPNSHIESVVLEPTTEVGTLDR
jgi:hypothetical protein